MYVCIKEALVAVIVCHSIQSLLQSSHIIWEDMERWLQRDLSMCVCVCVMCVSTDDNTEPKKLRTKEIGPDCMNDW